MRRLTIISAALLSMSLLAGCRTDTGSKFEPTAMGYRFAQQTESLLRQDLDRIVTLLHFRDYLAAETDEERIEINDSYFYNSRIVGREDNVWELTGEDLFIDTGGTMLDTDGDEWRFASRNSENFSTVTLLDCGDVMRFEVDFVEGNVYYTYESRFAGEITVEDGVAIPGSDASKQSAYRFSVVSGEGGCNYYGGDYTFTVLVPLTGSTTTSNYLFTEGRVRFRATADGVELMPEAMYEGSAGIVVFGGRDNAYEQRYQKSYYYYYE